MRPALIFKTVVSVAVVAVGIAWALPATALGIAAGLTIVLFRGGVAIRGAVWALRTMLQPGASEEERRQALLPRWAGTVWVGCVAAACGVVAYETEQGVLGDAHGYAFFPLMLPWLLLTVAPFYRELAQDEIALADVRPELDSGR